MSFVTPPVLTDTVDQNFFIESLGGPRDVTSYLDAFPDAVYHKALDSVLVTFLYALLGPAGAGYLRETYLLARLEIEEAGLSTANLDALYTNPFAFARMAEETYDIDANASLLSSQDAAQVLAFDADFRNRAVDFLKGVRGGTTPIGLTLVAKSGADRPVDLIENYKTLYDQHSDLPLGLAYVGQTLSLNEVIVLPRQDVPQNTEQTFVLTGMPVSGWFTITIPLGPPYQTVQVGIVDGSDTITAPTAQFMPPGTYVSITSNTGSSIGTSTPVVYAEAGATLGGLDPTSINLIYPPYSGSTAGQPYIQTLMTGTYWAYVGNAETIPLPSNADATMIQDALQNLPVVGLNNVQVTGGPLPNNAITVTFVNDLGDESIAALQVNTVPQSPFINGLGVGAPQMVDNSGSPLTISSSITVDTVGSGVVETSVTPINAANQHAMIVALDQTRPQTALFTTQKSQSVTQRVKVNAISSSDGIHATVLRYETGKLKVRWPHLDGTHWIEAGIEHEAPKPIGTIQYQYCGFHNIQNVYAYTEAALTDPLYSTDLADIWSHYWDIKVGPYSPTQRILYPFLNGFHTRGLLPIYAIAASPEPQAITNIVGSTAKNGRGGSAVMINDIYPRDYLGLPGVGIQQSSGRIQRPPNPAFWGSTERTVQGSNPSIDYLEIDLGSVQAVNYIYFEATNKPYFITADYDTLDQSPTRNFVAVTFMDPTIASSTTLLSYKATSQKNPWSVVELHFTNAINQMVFTRYIRLGFHRNPTNSPFAPGHQLPPNNHRNPKYQPPLNAPAAPYSIEVRNLRIGRNLSSPLDRALLN